MNEAHLLDFLKQGMFGRLGLMFIMPFNPTESSKVKRDIRAAKKENDEADKYIRHYIHNAKRFFSGNNYHLGGIFCSTFDCKKTHLPF